MDIMMGGWGSVRFSKHVWTRSFVVFALLLLTSLPVYLFATMAPRATSAPARVREVGGDDLSGSVSVADADLSNSNGCGGASPTARQFLIQARTAILNLLIMWSPVFKVDLFEGSVYCMIYWNPSHPSGARIRGVPWPEQWHTTLMKAVPSSMALVASEASRFQSAGQAMLDTLYASLRTPTSTGPLVSWLNLPPWSRSWNFGTPTSLGFSCEILMAASEAWLYQLDSQVRIRERRLFHISWH